MLVHGAAVGLSPFDVRVTLQPLMALSWSMESMGLRYILRRRTAFFRADLEQTHCVGGFLKAAALSRAFAVDRGKRAKI